MTLNEFLRRHPVQWHGVRLNSPDWGHTSHRLAAAISIQGVHLLHLIVNAYWEALDFETPPVGPMREGWRRCIDTSADSPHDICDWADVPAVETSTCTAGPRSVVVLMAA